ncbi:hypothetical protein [Rummeliibacillus pycnus]|uniref:hypothetical protein n=1 Tax=Rummeliibacillus pycnus TaxID=101070 RepID=UPI0037C5029F
MSVDKFNAIVGANIKNFISKMKQVDQAIRKTATGANANIGANVREFNRKMMLVRKSLTGLQYKRSDANIGADISRFNKANAMLKAKMLALSSSKVVVQVKADWNNFREGWKAGQQMMGKIASSMRNFGEIIGTSLQGAFISVLPAISPIIANLGGLIGSLGPVIGTVAGQAAGLGAAFTVAYASIGSVAMMATSNIKALYEKNAVLNESQKQTKASIESVKATYQSLTQATQKPILSATNKAMQVTNSILNTLKPLFVSSAQAVDKLMSSLQKNIDSPPIQKFLNYLNTTGAPMLIRFGQAFGNVFKGLASMLTAFAPLADSTSKGFLSMTQSFATWSAGLSKSEKFQEFITYVQTNMPKIKSIFSDAILGIVGAFSAFAPMSSDMLTSLQNMMSKFKEWGQSLSENKAFQQFCDYVVQTAPSVMSLIGNLTTFIVNLGIGMAPLGAKILELANSFLSWTNNMMSSNPVIGQIIAIVTSLTGVIMVVLPWILSVGTGFLKIIPSITSFASSIFGLIPKITSVATTIINLASKALPWLIRGLGLLTGPIGIAVAVITTLITVGVALYKNWDTIKEKCTELAKVVVLKLGELAAKGIAKFNDLKTQATTKINELKSKVISIVANLVVSAVNKFNELKTGAINKITSLVTSTVNKFNELKTSAVNKVVSLVTGVVNKFGELKTSASNKVSEMVSAVTNKFREMVSAVGNKMSEIKGKVENGWNKAKSFLDGIDLVAVGKHIIQGLINGITSKVKDVASAAKSVAKAAKDAITGFMDIHSPSRVMDQQGQYTGQGYARGISKTKGIVSKSARSVAAAAKKAFNEGMRGLDLKLQAGSISTSSYVKQAKALGNKYKSVANAQNVVAAKIQKATTAKAVQAQKERHAKQVKLQQDFNAELANLNNKYSAGKIDESQYIKSLENMKSKYSSVTNAISKIDVKISKAKKQMIKEQFDDDKAYYEKKLNAGKLTAAQEVQLLTDMSKKYKKNSEERVYFEQLAANKKKEIYDGLIALNEEFTAKIQEANQKLIDGEKALNDEYDKTLADRANTIKNFVGIFDEIPDAAETSGQQLKDNLQAQVNTIRSWSENMASLAARGIDKGLLQELQALGPSAASQIAALNTLSDTELQDYVGLWQEKSELATNIATSELTDLRANTDAQIAQLRTDTAAQLATYNAEWQTAIKDLTGQTTDKFNALTKSMPQIGRNVIKGMQNGLTELTPSLLAQAQSIANSIKETIQSALDIHSPSRWGDKMIGQNLILGISNGMERMKSYAVKTAQNVADGVKTQLAESLVQTDALGYSASLQSTVSKELAVKVKVEVDGDNGSGGGTAEIHNHYNTRPMSEAEMARQQKRQLQKLGLQFV